MSVIRDLIGVSAVETIFIRRRRGRVEKQDLFKEKERRRRLFDNLKRVEILFKLFFVVNQEKRKKKKKNGGNL